ncbi:Leucine-rich repeat [Sesbania bispinosa]|nr:Leucine-rich repeat [Sesbania bispinosa]
MRIPLVSLLLSFILCFHISLASAKCLHHQQSLLLQFKNNLTFRATHSIKLKYWNESIDCCDWSGVTCDNEGRVIGLELSGESISGGLDNSTTSLFSLQHLQKLNLAYNSFSSDIPSGFSKLEKLTYLNLSHAGFGGQIPTEISHLTRLVTLDLSSNSYYDEGLKLENPNLRKLVQNLTCIRQLYLDGVSITGEGQEWCNALLPLCDLQELSLSDCGLSGPLDSSLTRLKNLSLIILDGNDFSSPVPETFANFKNLTTLSLSGCGLTGTFPQEIFQIGTLSFIDLSDNYYLNGLFPDFPLNGSLRTIRVSNTNFSGALPHSIGNLRHLSELDLSYCGFNGKLPNSLSSLTEVSYLDLSQNNFTGPMPSFGKAANLTHLDLSYNGLYGTFPQEIFQKETLSVIDISGNENLHGLFPDFPLNGSLQTIRVSNTNFSGPLPHSIGNLRHLSELVISTCQLNGTIPNSVSNLTTLNYLDLSYNSLTGPIPSFGMLNKLTHLDLSHNAFSGTFPSSSHFQGLHNLDLSYNSFSGSIPSSLFTLPLLQQIDLSNNHFNQVDESVNVSSSVLQTLNLNSNNLSGPFPESIWDLHALYDLDLSSNKFHGLVQLNKLLKLINLTTLDLSYNNLSFDENVTNVDSSSFPNIQSLNLVSCNLKTFPGFLRNLSSMSISLDLSNNQIQGIVPNWIWRLENLFYLNISNNLLTDLEGPMQNLTSTVVYLDLHNNQIQGSLPAFPSTNYLDCSRNKFSSVIPQHIGGDDFLSLSNNNLYGNIPHSFCNAEFTVLDLSFNNISGTIPSCLSMIHLEIFNLRENNLRGPIPDKLFGAMFIEDIIPGSCGLKFLNLGGNLLDGPIPKSLSNCSILEVLDLGNNQIIGDFPCFLRNISSLRVLVLRSNKFQGPVGCSEANKPWKLLQIVDIAFNNFSGKLPGKYFKTWNKMMHDEDQAVSIHMDMAQGPYQYSTTVANKGQQMELVKILTIFTSIDFSSNHFEGPIPRELMDFKALHVLNLSNNALSGEMPSFIGNLKQLESLDLSHNSLSGEIPVQLASLTFLSYLNLSFNHLVGKIPTGTQVQSFPASSFEGNDGLYGPPLDDERPDTKNQGLSPQQACRRLACSIDWNFISAEVGFVSGLGIFIGPLLFLKQWRVWYWQLVNKILCFIFPQLYLEHVTRRGQRYTVLRWWY